MHQNLSAKVFGVDALQWLPLILFTLVLLIPTITQSAFSNQSGITYGDCDVAGNTLFLRDGAAVGTNGALAFSEGGAAARDTMPPSADGSHLVYRIENVTGTYTAAPTRF